MIDRMISRTAEYAVRAMATLQAAPGVTTGTTTLARRIGVPANYLSKIMHALGRAGLVRATRGPGGGFCLSRPASEISAWEIVCLFDVVESQRHCFLGSDTCGTGRTCTAHDRWSRVRDGYETFLRQMTLDRLNSHVTAPKFRPRKHTTQR